MALENFNRYETHLTLAASEAACLDEIGAWALSTGYKWTRILLDQGDSPDQPMLTFRGRESVHQQRAFAQTLIPEIVRRGGQLVRIKIEAEIQNTEVPRDACRAETYFEHHVKVLLPEGSDLMELSRRIGSIPARLSRNARRCRADGSREQFITQRVFQAGLADAQRQLDRLLDVLNEAGDAILEIEQEYVVFDSNLDLDRGWWNVPEPQP